MALKEAFLAFLSVFFIVKNRQEENSCRFFYPFFVFSALFFS